MRFFTDLSIRYKLFLGFLLIFVVFALFVGYFLVRLSSIDSSFEGLNSQARKLQLFLRLESDNNIRSDSVKSYILTKDPTWEKNYDSAALDITDTLYVLQSISESRELVNIAQFEKSTTQLYGIELLILAEAKSGNVQKATTLYDDNYQNAQTVSAQAISRLVSGENQDFLATLQQDNDALNASRNFLFAISFFILLFITCLAFLTSFFIERSLKQLMSSVNKVSQGDLNARVPVNSKDELGQLATTFNTMTQKLQVSYAELEQTIQVRTQELEKAKTGLEEQIKERTQELQLAKNNLEQQVTERTKELQQKLTELEEINNAMVDRELKMIELKNQIKVYESKNIS